MMNSFFSVYTLTPWDNLKPKQLTQVKLLSLKSILKIFPVIKEEFFDDLNSKLVNNKHYSLIKSIKRIVGPDNEDYDISNFNFVWAFDDQRRMFQFLFQKQKEQGILVALAPLELAKLFSDHGKEAILRTLSLLNIPSKIKFLIILTPKGKSIVEEQQLFRMTKQQYEKLKYTNILKQLPNISGQWFPSFAPKCPICNTPLTGIEGYNIGFGKLVCPHCGYEAKR